MKIKRRAVFNWSGGKDSALALYKVLNEDRFEVVALLTTVNKLDGRSSMHGIPVPVLEKQAESIGIPLSVVELDPGGGMTAYEDAYGPLISRFKSEGVGDFIFGDIFLHDVLSYRQKQLEPYGINVIEPLWDMTTSEVMDEFLRSGLRTIIVTTMAEVLGKDYVGRNVDRVLVDSLPEGVDICGENGEYHTLCYDGPIFRKRVEFSLGQPFIFSNDIGLDDGTVRTYSYWTANILY